MQANHQWRSNQSTKAQIDHLRILADTCPYPRKVLTLQTKIEAMQAKLALDTLRKLRAARGKA